MCSNSVGVAHLCLFSIFNKVQVQKRLTLQRALFSLNFFFKYGQVHFQTEQVELHLEIYFDLFIYHNLPIILSNISAKTTAKPHCCSN